jgi:hypothetical protein
MWCGQSEIRPLTRGGSPGIWSAAAKPPLWIRWARCTLHAPSLARRVRVPAVLSRGYSSVRAQRAGTLTADSYFHTNSVIARAPSGSRYCGRPNWSGNCIVGSMPSTWNTVAMRSLGVMGVLLGTSALADDSPTT